MCKIIIRTFAYNAEKTLERTIKSILSQTYSDFVWYLLDNGSTDTTGEIIRKYANLDNRIIFLRNEVNRYDTEYSIGLFHDIIEGYDDSCYFCTLDSDDEYESDFFCEMLNFIQKDHLEIAACSVGFYDGETNTLIGKRTLGHTLVLTRENRGTFFPETYQFMRTIWGKLFSLSVLRKCSFKRIKDISYGNDTLFSIEAFQNAERVGISDKVLHKYYIHVKSVSNILPDEKRLASAGILLEQGVSYLMKFQGVNEKNRIFLMDVFLSSCNDTINCTLQAHVSSKEKMNLILQVIRTDYFRKISQETEKSLFLQIRKSIFMWLKQDFSSLYQSDVGKMIEISTTFHINELLYGFFWEVFSFNSIKQNSEEDFLRLGLSLAAINNKQDDFIRLKKQIICNFIKKGENLKALKELDDFDQLLPEDKEFKRMREILTEKRGDTSESSHS